jgi:hypothetical protein
VSRKSFISSAFKLTACFAAFIVMACLGTECR